MSRQYHQARHRYAHQGLWGRWVLAMTIGELVGFAIPAIVGTAAWSLGMSDLAIAILVSLAGAGEGAVLGFAQWLALRRVLAIDRRDWVLATTLAAVVAYMIGMLPSNLGDLTRFNTAILIGAGLVLGIVFLVSIGFAQWLILRRRIPNAAWWIPANAIAWPLGVAVPVGGLALVPDGAPAVAWIVTGIACGVAMGAVVGALTGIVLVWMLRAGQSKAPTALAAGLRR
jgi:hypothetical protein